MKRPVGFFRSHPHGQSVPLDLRIRILEVQMFRNNTLLHGKQGLYQTGNACCRLQMSDVRLYRAHQQRVVGFALSAVHRTYCVDFNRVPQ